MTLYEYEARMYAYRLKQVDDAEVMHKQAWLNHEVTATKAKGKNGQEYVFRTFKQFFDVDKHMAEATGESTQEPKHVITEQMKRMARIAKEFNKKEVNQ